MPRIVGSGGEIRVGYQRAASIGAWALVTAPREDGEVTVDLELTPVALDPYWSQQRPMDVSLSWFGSRRIWRNVAPETTGSTWRLTGVSAPEVM